MGLGPKIYNNKKVPIQSVFKSKECGKKGKSYGRISFVDKCALLAKTDGCEKFMLSKSSSDLDCSCCIYKTPKEGVISDTYSKNSNTYVLG